MITRPEDVLAHGVDRRDVIGPHIAVVYRFIRFSNPIWVLPVRIRTDL